MKPENYIASILNAAGGQLIGRVRLQKAVYLLDQLDFKSGFCFEYHHYGPYSRALDLAVAEAKSLKKITEERKCRDFDGAMYSVFEVTPESSADQFDKQYTDKAAKFLKQFNDTKITILELAATAHYLWKYEKIEDWKSELKKRKGAKVENGRLEKAIELLDSLQLTLPTSLAV